MVRAVVWLVLSLTGASCRLVASAPGVCGFAAEGVQGRGPVQKADCRRYYQLHVESLVASDRLSDAVGSYRTASRKIGKEARRDLATAILRWGLRHKTPAVRVAAIQLVRLHDVPLTEYVATQLGDGNEVVRTWAAVTLFQTLRGKEVLLQQLRSSDPAARVVALRAVGRLYKSAALPLLVVGTQDDAPAVRAAAAVGLASTRSAAALGPLVQLARDPDERVRVRSIAALGSRRTNEALDVIKGALDDNALMVRNEAVRALGRFEPGKVKALLRRTASGKEISTELLAAVALARFGETQPALNAIAKALADRNWFVRVLGLRAAGATREAVAAELARRKLADSDPQVQIAAVRAMWAHQDIGGETAAQALQATACRTVDPKMDMICLDAARLLARRSRRALSALQRLARRSTLPPVRIAALKSAMDAGADEEVALTALCDPDPLVVVEAAAAIY